MHRYEQIRYCPRCGNSYRSGSFVPSEVSFECSSCGFTFYQNSVPSVSILIPSARKPDHVLLMTRSTEPGGGKVALPGGFLRYGEEPAAGARRETLEETRLEAVIDRLLCPLLVDYCYLGAQISVLELSFLALPMDVDPAGLQTIEASLLAFYPADQVLRDPERLAFPEQAGILAAYLNLLTPHADASSEERYRN